MPAELMRILIGLVAGVVAVFGIIPFVGWANWFVIPIAGLGLVLGLLSRHREGQILNIVVIAVALAIVTLVVVSGRERAASAG